VNRLIVIGASAGGIGVLCRLTGESHCKTVVCRLNEIAGRFERAQRFAVLTLRDLHERTLECHLRLHRRKRKRVRIS